MMDSETTVSKYSKPNHLRHKPKRGGNYGDTQYFHSLNFYRIQIQSLLFQHLLLDFVDDFIQFSLARQTNTAMRSRIKQGSRRRTECWYRVDSVISVISMRTNLKMNMRTMAITTRTFQGDVLIALDRLPIVNDNGLILPSSCGHPVH